MKRPKGIIGVIGLLVPAALMASEAETHAGGSAWLDFAGKLVNFIILFGGLAYFLARPLRAYLQSRTYVVQKQLEEATAGRLKAEQELTSLIERLARIKEEIIKLKREAEEEGMKERERILTAAGEEATRIEKLAALEIEALKRGAIRELKSHAASLATALAEERIRGKLTPDAHRRLIRLSIERLARLHEGADYR